MKPWFSYSNLKSNHSGKIAIIGGGVSGCSLAYHLKTLGVKSTIFERERVAAGPSGNYGGLVFPVIEKKTSKRLTFGLRCFQEFEQLLKKIESSNIETIVEGEQVVMQSNKTTQIAANLQLSDDHKLHAQDQIKIKAYTIRPQKLTKYLFQNSGAALKHEAVESFAAGASSILLKTNQSEYQFRSAIFANGHSVNKLLNSRRLGLRSNRGFMGLIRGAKLDHSFSGPYYALALRKMIAFGASGLHESENSLRRLSERLSTELLKSMKPEFLPQFNRTAWRNYTHDYLPLVGALPDFNFYERAYHEIRKGFHDDHYPSAEYIPNCYVLTGYGGRGLLFSFYSAKVLSKLIKSPNDYVEDFTLLHPARHFIRSLLKP